MKSNVYFTDFRTDSCINTQEKLIKLSKAAGLGNLNLKKTFVAIKMHFGELGNLAFLRHNFAKTVTDLVKEKEGFPFLTDANTLYYGKRSNALDHLECAYLNGFSPLSVGCHILIADGLRGNEYLELPVRNGVHLKTAKVGNALANADVIISLTHFKGHEMSGFGGVIKNIGMGGASRAGKMEMHATSQPEIIKENCVACGMCVKNCSQQAISFVDKKATIDYSECVGCGQCLVMCRYEAINSKGSARVEVMCEKMSEYTQATLEGKESFHISIINNVSPQCDCWDNNDVPIVPDIGMLASFDTVALDKACIDLVNSSKQTDDSLLVDKGYKDGDKFAHIHPDTHWQATLDHGEKIGLGSQDYELIKI